MNTIVDRWWLLALRGAAAILFGVLTFVAPMASLLALVILFGAFALVDGLLYLFLGLRGASQGGERWGWLAFAGAAGIVAGLGALIWPRLTGLALLLLIAAWAMVTGAASLFAAIRLRRQIRGEWLLATSGVLSIAFGVLATLFPGAGAMALALWIGAYALVMGGILLGLAFRLRAASRERGRMVPVTPAPAAA